MKKLEISEVLKDGFSIAFKNILSLIGAFLLGYHHLDSLSECRHHNRHLIYSA